ncbi:MAG: (Fe-S)-binding protein [Candidatus Dormibacteria bacterium]
MTDLVDVPGHAQQFTPRFLADVHDAAAECNKCSLCQAVCPTYVTNPVEWETARGRVSLIRDAIEGRLELHDIEDGPLSTCLTCDNCVAACAPRVPTALIVSRARQELHEQEGHAFGQRFALRSILPRPGMLSLLHGLSRASQVTGLHWLARTTGLTAMLGTAGAYMSHDGPLPAKTAYHRVDGLPAASTPVRGRVGFLVCCYANLATPAATEATMRVLLGNGFELTVPRLACGGLPAKTLGDREAMLDMGVGNLTRMRGMEVDALVGDVAACVRHYQDYAAFLGDDREVGTEARQVSSLTRTASQFLAEAGVTAPLGPLRWRVAFDEPCSYPHERAVRRAPYALLERVPALEVVPLHEAEMCCGGAGSYFHRQPERSRAILRRKFENVVASGAEVLVTENVSCLTQLRAGAREFAPKVRVLHLFEVLEASMESARRRSAVLPRG